MTLYTICKWGGKRNEFVIIEAYEPSRCVAFGETTLYVHVSSVKKELVL